MRKKILPLLSTLILTISSNATDTKPVIEIIGLAVGKVMMAAKNQADNQQIQKLEDCSNGTTISTSCPAIEQICKEMLGSTYYASFKTAVQTAVDKADQESSSNNDQQESSSNSDQQESSSNSDAQVSSSNSENDCETVVNSAIADAGYSKNDYCGVKNDICTSGS